MSRGLVSVLVVEGSDGGLHSIRCVAVGSFLCIRFGFLSFLLLVGFPFSDWWLITFWSRWRRGSAGKEIAMEVEHHSRHFLRARQSDVSLFQDDVFGKDGFFHLSYDREIFFCCCRCAGIGFVSMQTLIV